MHKANSSVSSRHLKPEAFRCPCPSTGSPENVDLKRCAENYFSLNKMQHNITLEHNRRHHHHHHRQSQHHLFYQNAVKTRQRHKSEYTDKKT